MYQDVKEIRGKIKDLERGLQSATNVERLELYKELKELQHKALQERLREPQPILTWQKWMYQ